MPRKIGRGSFALDRRIGGNNDLIHLAVLDPPHQIGDAQLLRTYAVQWRDRPMQHVINAVEVFGLLDGPDIGGFLDDANHPLVAGSAAAVDARIDICNVVAYGTQT